MSAIFLPTYLLEYSDSAFTNPHEALLAEDPPDCTGKFTHMGAQYWGFETRRHCATSVLEDEQALEYDHAASNWLRIAFVERVEVHSIKISTRWFTGNQVQAVSIILFDEIQGSETRVLERVLLKPDAEHEFEIEPQLASECLVQCYYEGGISRINFFGSSATEQPLASENLLQHAQISHVSNEHYGKPDCAVRGQREVMHMLGWESARTGFGEQALFHLRKKTQLREIVVDTYLHRLNSPLTAHVFGLELEPGGAETYMARAPRWKLVFEDGSECIPVDFQQYMLSAEYLAEGAATANPRFKIQLDWDRAGPWKAVLPFVKLRPDTFHRLRTLEAAGPFSHLLYMHYPNGGIHGLKLFGEEVL